ncbi:MliC family protein [Neptuniibacter halophilus]|uniref:MliC family protein n=1 Tax=Neptuniibacter halophilus TaxID=651666 RepID=UPI0025731CB1|nr:MliC family protein [Neptuniibacter halophilus]
MSVISPLLLAEADGPDYFRTEQVTAVLSAPAEGATLLTQIPARHNGLRNHGCVGRLSFADWSKLDQQQRIDAAGKVWCKVTYEGHVGWVRNVMLREGSAPQQPGYSCDKAAHEIEQLVCGDQELIRLDHLLNEVFRVSLRRAAGLDDRPDQAVKQLRARQRGWIKGRNACWKAMAEKRSCTLKRYQQRIAQLEADWGSGESGSVRRYVCGDNLANEVYFQPVKTSTLPAAIIEYGDQRQVFTAAISASGSRYNGEFGRYFWTRGEEALLVWDQRQPEQTCRLRVE